MKAIRRVGYTFGGLFAACSGYCTVLYLTRWEWQRALISAALLLVVEVFLATVVLLARLSRLKTRLDQSDARIEEVRQRLERTRAPAPNRFNRLRSSDLTELNGPTGRSSSSPS